jgi:citrate lyase subunit beta/citryl-CoA lyase
LLFVPAIRERMLSGAAKSGADAIVIDLEDAVPEGEKVSGREIARRHTATLAGAGYAVFVRINGIHTGMARDDVMAVVGPALTGVVLAKTESPQDLRDLDVLLREAEMASGVRPGDIATIPLIESAAAVLRCEQIAAASDRVAAISFGAEDYTFDMGIRRIGNAAGLQHARSTLAHVATALRIPAIDAPYADYKDIAGLAAEAAVARDLGMKGKYVIHPEQIATVNAAFTPLKQEVTYARLVIEAYERGLGDGLGAVNLDGRMVDAPIADRARAVLALAEAIASRKKKRPT